MGTPTRCDDLHSAVEESQALDRSEVLSDAGDRFAVRDKNDMTIPTNVLDADSIEFLFISPTL